jgi:hypothetical protein
MMLALPFTVPQFFAVFADYNAAIWPLQIVAYGLCVMAIVALWLSGPPSNRIILSALAIIWSLNGIGYHLLFFSAINPIAIAFAAVFLLQSMLLAAAFLVPHDLRFEVRLNFVSAAGLSVIVYALLIYELLGYWGGARTDGGTAGRCGAVPDNHLHHWHAISGARQVGDVAVYHTDPLVARRLGSRSTTGCGGRLRDAGCGPWSGDRINP